MLELGREDDLPDHIAKWILRDGWWFFRASQGLEGPPEPKDVDVSEHVRRRLAEGAETEADYYREAAAAVRELD